MLACKENINQNFFSRKWNQGVEIREIVGRQNRRKVGKKGNRRKLSRELTRQAGRGWKKRDTKGC